MLEKKENITIWFLFFVSPISALFFSIKRFGSSQALNIIWAFIIFYGFTFVISPDMATSDINRYIDKFQVLYNTEVNFDGFLSLLYDPETGNADILIPTINYLLSRFTNNPTILITTFAIIFGYFYSRNLGYILSKLKKPAETYIVFLMVIFALIVPFWYINGIRFWLAVHLFLYGVLPFLLDGKKGRLIFSILSVFVHFSFLFPIAILFLYLIFGNRKHLFFLFFLLSFLVSEINVQVLNTAISSYLPEVFYQRTIGYTNEASIYGDEEENVIEKTWYAVFDTKALRWSIIVLISIIYLKGNKIISTNKSWLRIFSFSMLIYAAANILSLIPSGGRFISLGNMFSLAFVILYLQDYGKYQMPKFFKLVVVPPLILFAIVSIREGWNSIGLITIIGNPIIASFMEADMALIELLK